MSAHDHHDDTPHEHDLGLAHDLPRIMGTTANRSFGRRRLLGILAGAGASTLAGCAAAHPGADGRRRVDRRAAARRRRVPVALRPPTRSTTWPTGSTYAGCRWPTLRHLPGRLPRTLAARTLRGLHRLAAATSGDNATVTSQLALPEAACTAAYATDGYGSSVRNLAQTSLDSEGMAATLTVGIRP